MVPGIDFSRARRDLAELNPVRVSGRVTDVIGLVVEATGPGAPVGSVCTIGGSRDDPNGPTIPAEVVGFRAGRVLLAPLGDLEGVSPGSRVTLVRERPLVRVGDAMLGRILDGLGAPLDRGGALDCRAEYPLYGQRMNPLDRTPIREPLDLGIRAINALLTCGRGQRLGIFAGSGVGKSALLGMMARYTRADVNVIALVGERGREVREFIERDLGDAIGHSVVVVATSDQPPLVRIRGAFLASAIAEYFRDQGKDVLLMMDSLTRVAMAQREVGLSVGEPPAARGYTPSVFALLPKLLERAGRGPQGSITGLYTVLVEGDDMNEPIADTARSLLDGHIVLSRKLASDNHYPAIDVLSSISRVMLDITGPSQQTQAGRVRSWLSTYREAEDLIQIGAYTRGASPAIDEAITRLPAITTFLRQSLGEPASLADAEAALGALVR
ncbi:MAG TPA: FliI/YscN family ATPase [Candidatus Binatia bacterium]|jgi:flagellum-specific ATP synthase|nr:FliI/YscN family ATPase [Candidatus Binatia bacterium]